MSKEILQADFIPVDLDNMFYSNGDVKLQFDEESFNSGMADGSYYAGIATALFNAGLEEESVASFIEEYMKATVRENGSYEI